MGKAAVAGATRLNPKLRAAKRPRAATVTGATAPDPARGRIAKTIHETGGDGGKAPSGC